MLTLLRPKQIWSRFGIAVTAVALTAGLSVGCSTTEVAPDKSILPEVPDYVKVPHPIGYELAEIRALFESPLAPKDGLGEFSQQCDSEYRMLTRATSIREDRKQGASELVLMNAEKMHWCFYGKVALLIKNMKSETGWKARQNLVLDAYEFLTPIATAFLDVYQDSRYLRWATQYYSNISEWVFFRKVVPGPENTLALTTSASSDLENWTTQQKKGEKKLSVFTRYGITLHEEEESRAPASAGFGFDETPPEPVQPLETQPGFSPQEPDAVPEPIGELDSKPKDPELVAPEKTKPKRKPANKAKTEEAPFAL